MGHWVHALCSSDPEQHLEGLESHLRAGVGGAFSAAESIEGELLVEVGSPQPPPFDLEWIAVCFSDREGERGFTLERSSGVAEEVSEFLGLLRAGRMSVTTADGVREVEEALRAATHILSTRLAVSQAESIAGPVARATALWFASKAGGLVYDEGRWLAPPDGIEIV